MIRTLFVWDMDVSSFFDISIWHVDVWSIHSYSYLTLQSTS